MSPAMQRRERAVIGRGEGSFGGRKVRAPEGVRRVGARHFRDAPRSNSTSVSSPRIARAVRRCSTSSSLSRQRMSSTSTSPAGTTTTGFSSSKPYSIGRPSTRITAPMPFSVEGTTRMRRRAAGSRRRSTSTMSRSGTSTTTRAIANSPAGVEAENEWGPGSRPSNCAFPSAFVNVPMESSARSASAQTMTFDAGTARESSTVTETLAPRRSSRKRSSAPVRTFTASASAKPPPKLLARTA